MRNRTNPIMFYLSDEEYETLQADLKRTGLSQSAYLRKLILGKPVQERLPIDHYRLCTEISRIGNNINQITRIANQHPEIQPDTEKVKILLERIQNLLERTI